MSQRRIAAQISRLGRSPFTPLIQVIDEDLDATAIQKAGTGEEHERHPAGDPSVKCPVTLNYTGRRAGLPA